MQKKYVKMYIHKPRQKKLPENFKACPRGRTENIKC